MSVTYDVFPELNLIIYVCTGVVTPTEFFKTGDEVLRDPRTSGKMKIILDFFNAEIETSVSDIHLAILKNKEAKLLGKEVGQTAVYTQSTALKFLGEALRQISFDTVTNFSIFHTHHDAIQWLKLPKEETLKCWGSLEKQTSQPYPYSSF